MTLWKPLRRLAPLSLALLAACSTDGTDVAEEAPPPGPIAIHGNKQTFEIAPVLLAAHSFYPGQATVKMGGIPNLVGAPVIRGFGEEGVADVATHAETQALRYSVDNPNLRIILNVTKGLYRIVARRSSGIESVEDLKGKRVATIAQTSSGYFLYRMLAKEGLTFEDITAVPLMPLSEMTKALGEKKVDAVVIWEPESENALRILGNDAIEFSGDGVYSEHFNLNSTVENLADPEKRRNIVAFVRAVMDAAAAIRKDPAEAKKLVVEAGGFKPEEVERSWKHHAFNADYPSDMLDVLVAEEQWLAEQNDRPARTREQLATLIDTSIFEEAQALKGGQ